MIEYFKATDIKERVDEIAELLRFGHLRPDSVHCIRSRGSKAERVIARIHGLGSIWQRALGLGPSYIVEVIAERFDDLPMDEQDRTLIHELLHIPSGFGGGFRPHKGYVTRDIVETWYRRYKQKRLENRR